VLLAALGSLADADVPFCSESLSQRCVVVHMTPLLHAFSILCYQFWKDKISSEPSILLVYSNLPLIEVVSGSTGNVAVLSLPRSRSSGSRLV